MFTLLLILKFYKALIPIEELLEDTSTNQGKERFLSSNGIQCGKLVAKPTRISHSIFHHLKLSWASRISVRNGV